MKIKCVISLIAILGCINCDGTNLNDPDNDDQSSLSKGDSESKDMIIKDIKTDNCDLFVDKVVADFNWHSGTGLPESHNLKLYFKLSPAMAENAEKVSFFGNVFLKKSNTADNWGQAYTGVTVPAQRYFNSKDYYVMSLNLEQTIEDDFSAYKAILDVKWEGAFYVQINKNETDNATGKKIVYRYWLNPNGEGYNNFVLDNNTFEGAQTLQNGKYTGRKGGSWTYSTTPLDQFTQTANYGIDGAYYLNPFKCK